MIYVHIPFCRSFCTYCGFYSEAVPICCNSEDVRRQEDTFIRFAEALTAEVRARKDEFESVSPKGVNTLYIGGGTPSVLPLDVYVGLQSALKEVGVDTRFSEFTIEVNPEDIVEKGSSYVEGLVKLGVNRVSMGVQSFDDGILRFMNRRHSSEKAVQAYRILEDAGIGNISIDLIFGLPQLSDELWQQTLDKVLAISSRGVPPRHISAYQLSVEPDSMLQRLVDKGSWCEASDGQCSRQYDILCEALGKAGYHHYEISNFAQPGFEAVHNSAYWRHVPYIGLGPGAHSCLVSASHRNVPVTPSQQSWVPPPTRGCENVTSTFPASMQNTTPCGKVIRRWNESSLEKYLKAGEIKDFRMVQDGEELSVEQMSMERVMLGLRTSSGLPEDVLNECCNADAVEAALACGDIIKLSDGNIRIPESRFFVSDRIIYDMV